MICFKEHEISHAVGLLSAALKAHAYDGNGLKISIDIDEHLLADILASVGNRIDGFPAYLVAADEAFPIKAFHPGDLTDFLRWSDP